jgi:MtN3 and saliva related transmembrane protein
VAAFDFTTALGLVAAFCTTMGFYPQLHKTWITRSADDLSLPMFLIIAGGTALWLVYGVLRHDVVIIVANAVSLCLLSGILYVKLHSSRLR